MASGHAASGKASSAPSDVQEQERCAVLFAGDNEIYAADMDLGFEDPADAWTRALDNPIEPEFVEGAPRRIENQHRERCCARAHWSHN